MAQENMNERTVLVEIITPDRIVFRGGASIVQLPGVNGLFEVMYNHAPLLAEITIGPLRVVTPREGEILFATSGGFVDVLNNNVIILAETAEPASEIDVERAKAAEERALKRLREAVSIAEREEILRDLERARNRLRVAMGAVGKRIHV